MYIVGDGRAQQLVTLFILESRGVIYFGVTRDACGAIGSNAPYFALYDPNTTFAQSWHGERTWCVELIS